MLAGMTANRKSRKSKESQFHSVSAKLFLVDGGRSGPALGRSDSERVNATSGGSNRSASSAARHQIPGSREKSRIGSNIEHHDALLALSSGDATKMD